jgi:hypothetical protein
MSAGPIERGWAEFEAESVVDRLDPDTRAALELAYHAGAAHALQLVGRAIQHGATEATLGSVLLAWADEILERSSRIEAEVFPRDEGRGTRGEGRGEGAEGVRGPRRDRTEGR